MRFDTSEDPMNDCLTVIDEQDQLKTSFDSEIILWPLEDATTIIRELNVQCAVVSMLIEHLEHYEDIDDIMYWIEETTEEI